ncbi:hypothetical protein STEG23_008979 [Scotinomys teguina]
MASLFTDCHGSCVSSTASEQAEQQRLPILQSLDNGTMASDMLTVLQNEWYSQLCSMQHCTIGYCWK